MSNITFLGLCAVSLVSLALLQPRHVHAAAPAPAPAITADNGELTLSADSVIIASSGGTLLAFAFVRRVVEVWRVACEVCLRLLPEERSIN